jgi:RND family efflux transporter MFP subunit
MTTTLDDSTKPAWAMSRREADAARRVRDGLPPRRRIWPWLILLLGLIGAGGAWWWQSRQEAAPDIAAPVPVIESRMQVNQDEYVTIAPITLQRTIKVIGTLRPSRQAELSSQTGGLVEAVNARPGDRVSEGQVLVQVDIERLTLDLDLQRSNAAASQAQLELAEGQLERAKALVDRGVSTASTLEQAQSSVDGLRASVSALTDQVAAAELNLRNASVRAPFDGIVSSRSVEPGAYVGIGSPFITVVDLSMVEMEANASVSAGALLRPGQPVTISVDGIADRTFPGTVERINPVATEGTRTIPVYVTLANTDGILLGGMFATGEVVVAKEENAIAIPTDAIREDGQGAYVLRIIDGTLTRQPVSQADQWEGGLTRLVDGLAPGDVVVSAALPELSVGDLVTLVGN